MASQTESYQLFDTLSPITHGVSQHSGKFHTYIPIASLMGNNGLGPKLDINLFYSPDMMDLTFVNWGLRFSHYLLGSIASPSHAASILYLSQGEAWSFSEAGYSGTPNFNVTFPDAGGKTMRVTWKDGTVEILERHISTLIVSEPISNLEDAVYYVLKKVITSTGHSLTLEWEDYRQPGPSGIIDWNILRLTSISDESHKLLNIRYPTHDKTSTDKNFTRRPLVDGVITFSVYPESPKNYTHEFQITTAGMVRSSKNTVEDVTQYSYDAVDTAPGLFIPSKVTRITRDSGLSEFLSYTADKLKIAKHTKTSGSNTYGDISYTYSDTTTTAIDSISNEKNDYYFDSNKRQIKQVSTLGSNIKTIESDFATANDQLTLTTRTTYQNKAQQTRTETNVTTLDILGNLLSTTQDGLTTEWTYYRGAPKEELLVKKETFTEINGPLSVLGWVGDNINPIGWGFQLFGNAGLTWGTRETRTTTHSRFNTNTARQTYNLPVDIACPGDANYFKVYIESEKIYTMRNGQRVDLQWSFYGYSDVEVRGTEIRGPAVKPTTKLTVYNPTADANGRLTSWQNGNMTVEETQYVTNVNSPDHGRTLSSSQRILDTRGNTIANSTVNTALTYILNGETLSTTSTITAGNTPAMIQSETQQTLTSELLGSIDKQGNKTTYEYDASGRMTKKVSFAGDPSLEGTTTFAYQDSGISSTVTLTSPLNEKVRQTYNGLNRLIKTERLHADGKAWLPLEEITYDNQERAITLLEYDYWQDGRQLLRKVNNFSYDEWGQLSKAQTDGGQGQGYQNDPVSQQQTEWTSYGTQHAASTVRIFDEAGGGQRHETMVFTNGQLVSSTSSLFDALGHLTKQSSSDAPTREYSYDALGRRSRITVDGVVTINEFPANYPIEAASKASVNSGSQSYILGSQTIDSLGRLTSTTIGGVTTQYAYKGVGVWGKASVGHDRTQSQTQAIRLSSVFDEQTRRITETVTGGIYRSSENETSQATYTYSLQGRLLKTTDNFGNNTDFTYDALGRLASTASAQIKAYFNYGLLDRLESEALMDLVSGKNLVTSYTYDAQGREAQREIKAAGFKTLILRQEYANAAQLNSMEVLQDNVSMRKENYTYNASGRLIKFMCNGSVKPTTPGGVTLDGQEFGYDIIGNITTCTNVSQGISRTDTYNYGAADPTQRQSANLYSADNTSRTLAYQYDNLGFLQKHNGSELTYNSRGQLGYLTKDQRNYEYFYDSTGRLVGCAGDRYAEQFYYKGDIQYARKGSIDINGTIVSRTSIQLNQSRSCVLLQNSTTPSGGQTTISNSFEVKDLKGSVIASYDLTNNAATLFAYTPFGYRRHSAEQRSWVGFNGQPIDSITGHYHLGNGVPVYNPGSQFYEAPDVLSPFGSGGANRYSYCHNDPVNYSDPTGYAEIVNQYTVTTYDPALRSPIVQAIILAAIGVALAPFTGGASIGWTVVAIGFAFVSGGFGIAAAALEESDPHLSRIFGFISIGTGLVSAGVGAIGSKVAQTGARTGLYAAANEARLATRYGGVAKGEVSFTALEGDVSGKRILFDVYSGGPNAKIAQIEAHGVPLAETERFLVSDGTAIRFFAPKEAKIAMDPARLESQLAGGGSYYTKLHGAFRNKLTPNYLLKPLSNSDLIAEGIVRTPAEIDNAYKALAARYGVDIIRPRSNVMLSDLTTALESQRYNCINASFCRGPISEFLGLSEVRRIRNTPAFYFNTVVPRN